MIRDIPPRRRFAPGTLAGRALLVGVALLTATGVARGYDPATTHAGLTERAVLASSLNKVLARRLGKPLGLFEPITLDVRELPDAEARYLTVRLGALDPAQGYRPGNDGVATALGWVVAGAVIAGTPAERGQHTFFDPSRKRGLNQGGGVDETALSLRLLMDAGGSPRAIATGTSFDFQGEPSTRWLVSTDNDVGLATFYAELERSLSSATPAARSTALARALLALGGTLSVLQDAGEPAHVRNDFRRGYQDRGGQSPFDRGSAYERFVAETFGRTGVPSPAKAVERPNAIAFITDADAQGLADRTQRRFFSAGSLPADAVVDRDTTTVDVVRQARDTAPYGLPRVARLDLQQMGQRRYLLGPDDNGQRPRLLGYERVQGRVRYFLDERVFDDTARALLPEIGAYSVGLIDHLLRVGVTLNVSGGQISVHVDGAHGALRAAVVRVYAEGADGQRREIGQSAVAGEGEIILSTAPPAGTKRLAVVLRGEDAAGSVIAVSEQSLR